ncbi:hypothetical protein [Nocardioides sp. WS12]|uniref:hypothetical protein n=1 Tax=Nocardioides sp. WS12 TaxID=2486272 RepID=UPI0015F93B2A|nr:hypothetical protein [Nocardioides sp. WS12]
MIDRRTLRRMFLSAFDAEGLKYANGGCQLVHKDLKWSISIVVDGSGKRAPYRLILGASLPQLGDLAPRNAEDCYLFLPLPYGDGEDETEGAIPFIPDAAFPDWAGENEVRAAAIARCVAQVIRYAQGVDSSDALRARYVAGDYNGAFIIAPMRSLLDVGS